MENSYYSYLLELFPEKKQQIEWMKMGLDSRIYHYGSQIRFPREGMQLRCKIKSVLFDYKRHLEGLFNTSTVSFHGCILSNSYFGINNIIEKRTGCPVFPFPWESNLDLFSQKSISRIIRNINNASYKDILSDCFCNDMFLLYKHIMEFLRKNGIRGIICYNDMTPLDRMAIDAGKELQIPTFVFLHGLPGRYDSIDDNRADFLCVWGNGIKKQYINVGVCEDKILVTGHPKYSSIKFENPSEVDFSYPLVLTQVSAGIPSDSTCYYGHDRAISINYPWCVEKALKEIGVRHAVIRTHPSENPEWYKNYIDTDFYTIDTHNLQDSLLKASLVIGPTSTVCLDSAISKVPYFGFSPNMKYAPPLVSPFDNSEEDFPIAFSIKELSFNLKNNRCMKPGVFNKYISDNFDISPIVQRILL